MNKKTKKVINGTLTTAMLTTIAVPALADSVDSNKLYEAAYYAVKETQIYGTQESINVARKAILALKGTDASFAIGEFSKQVDGVQQKLFVEFMSILFDGNNKPVKEVNQSKINRARELVLSFATYDGNGPYIASWSTAVDKYQQDNINTATRAVEKAEFTSTEENVQIARDLVDQLLTVKNDSKIKAYAEVLETRLDKISLEFKLLEVSASNNKEIEVSFSRKVDKKHAEDLANYRFTTKGQGKLINGQATLLEDEKTVRLTLDREAKTQETFELEVLNIKDSNGNTLSKTKRQGTFFDSQAPLVEGIKAVGPRELEVEFSEPLKAAPKVTLDNGQYSATVTHTPGSRIATVRFTSDMSAKEHTVTIEGGYDFAGYKVSKVNKTFNYSNNTEEVTAQILGADQTEATIKFNKPVKINTKSKVTVFHTYNNKTSYKGTIDAKDPVSGYSDTYVLKFSSPMVGGVDNKIFINTEKDSFEDKWGNDVKSLTLNTEISIDKTAPEVLEVKAEKDNKLTVKFNEKVSSKDAIDRANYVLKKSNGTVLTNKEYSFLNKDGKFTTSAKFSYNNDKQTVTIELPSALRDGDFTLTVSGITDVSYNENKMTKQDASFSVVDTTAPTISNVMKNGSKIRVVFSEEMKTEGLEVLSNYELVNRRTGKVIAFHKEAQVRIVDGRTVEIDLYDDVNLASYDMKVRVNGNLKDSNGIKIDGIYAEYDIVDDSINKSSISEVYTSSKNQVSLVVNQQLDGNLNSNKFEVIAGGRSKDIDSVDYINKDGKCILTITLDEDDELATDATPVVRVKAGALTNEFETSNANDFTTAPAEDRIAPEVGTIVNSKDKKLDDIRKIASNKIEITFTEAINMGSVSTQTFEVEGFKVIGIAPGVGDKSIKLTVQPISNEVLELGIGIKQKNAIEDKAPKGNVLVDFEGEISLIG